MKKILFFLLATLFVLANPIIIPEAFKANFMQQIKNPKGKIIRYRGVIYFNAPDTTKWYYNSPTKKEVCSSDGKLVIIDHDLEQAEYYTIEKGVNLAKILAKAKQYKGNTYVTKYKGKYYTIVVNKKGQVTQIAYKDNLGNTVNIFFTNIQYRKTPFPLNKFLCIRPINYDTIH